MEVNQDEPIPDGVLPLPYLRVPVALRQAELLQDFRRQVEQDVGRLRPFFDDFYLRRFLRARGHDLSKAKAMFLAHLKFRKDYGVDTVLEDFDFQVGWVRSAGGKAAHGELLQDTSWWWSAAGVHAGTGSHPPAPYQPHAHRSGMPCFLSTPKGTTRPTRR